MTTIQLKSEIEKVLDTIPEDALTDVLEYLKSIQQQSPADIKFDQNLRRIISEDRGLLKRLAE